MAEGGFDFDNRRMRRPKVQQLCRYFLHGACDRGEDCKFLHDRSGTTPTNNVCKYYQLGQCSYGNRCRYDHIKAGRNPNKTENKTKHKSSPSVPIKQNQDQLQNIVSWGSSMVSLKKGGSDKNSPLKEPSGGQKNYEKKWAKAKDFVPGQKFHAGASYARAAYSSDDEDNTPTQPDNTSHHNPKDKDLLCPYFAHGECPYTLNCPYTHGDICDVCQFPRLHPTDTAQRESHMKECFENVEYSFAVQESKAKECCICLELVLEKSEKEAAAGASKSKTPSDQQFGILENCTHCFCLSCIRRWRNDKSFGKNVRVCPICRVHSDFVTPSNVWVEDEEKKKKVIQDYKDALSVKHCQYFKQGKGRCPFNEKCFYKHANPDGSIAKPRPRKPRRRMDANGESNIMEDISLWDYLERREDGLISLEDELSLYLLGMLQDSDDDFENLFFFDTDTDTDSDDDFYI